MNIIFAFSLWQPLINFLNACFERLRAWGQSVFEWFFSQFATYIPIVNWYGIHDTIQGINAIIPFNEIMAYGNILGVLWIGVMIYRIIKSWIPFVGK